jgi:hypothetical protein
MVVVRPSFRVFEHTRSWRRVLPCSSISVIGWKENIHKIRKYARLRLNFHERRKWFVSNGRAKPWRVMKTIRVFLNCVTSSSRYYEPATMIQWIGLTTLAYANLFGLYPWSTKLDSVFLWGVFFLPQTTMLQVWYFFLENRWHIRTSCASFSTFLIFSSLWFNSNYAACSFMSQGFSFEISPCILRITLLGNLKYFHRIYDT